MRTALVLTLYAALSCDASHFAARPPQVSRSTATTAFGGTVSSTASAAALTASGAGFTSSGLANVFAARMSGVHEDDAFRFGHTGAIAERMRAVTAASSDGLVKCDRNAPAADRTDPEGPGRRREPLSGGLRTAESESSPTAAERPKNCLSRQLRNGPKSIKSYELGGNR